jgi:hypothetical protein
MARPSKNTINHGAESWDTAVNDNFSLIFDTPIPIAIYTNVAAFPAASSYEDCIAVAQDTDQAYISDGTSWNLLGGASTFLDLSDTPASFSGQAGKVAAVNSGETALEFVDMSSGEDISREFYADFSTSETDMGITWHDGRKIYAKAVDLGALPNGASASTLKSVAHSITGLNEVVRLWGWATHTDGRTIPLPYMHLSNATTGEEVSFSANNTYIYLRANGYDFSSFSGTAIIWYTKTATGDTDSNFMNFSTSEQRTGLNWYDGRPIYCKVLTGLVGPNGSEVTVAHGISNFNELVFMDAYFGDSASWKAPMSGVADNSSSYHRLCYARINGTNLYYNAEGVNWSSRTNGHAILFYTKTDDEVPSPETYLGRDFNLQEVNTKSKWTDGKTIYKKVVMLGAEPNTTSDAIDLNLKDADTILWITGRTWNSTDSSWYPFPYFYTQPNAGRYAIRSGPFSLARKDYANLSDRTSYLIVYYTKNDPGQSVTIPANQTFQISTSGTSNGDGSEEAPFDSLATALTYLQNYNILGEVTLEFGSGTFSSATTINVDIPSKVHLILSGSAVTSISLTSIQSSSGSAGNYSIVLNVSSVSGLSTGQFCLIRGCSGGSNPDLMNGVYEITNVDAGNTRITVSSTAQKSISSGAVTGSIDVFNTKLLFTGATDGLTVVSNSPKIKMENLAIVASNASSLSGISALSCELEFSKVVVSGWKANGVFAAAASVISGTYFAAGNCLVGYTAENGSLNALDTAYYSNNSSDGIVVQNNSNLVVSLLQANNNGGVGLKLQYSSMAYLSSAKTLYNISHGISLEHKADLNSPSHESSNNSADGIRALTNSTAEINSCSVQNNTSNGLYALRCSQIFTSSESVSGNGTNYSPTATTSDDPTFGNRGSVIFNG